MNKTILHLNLKRKWFDMILSGEKTVEYRETSNYLLRYFTSLRTYKNHKDGYRRGMLLRKHLYFPEEILICFSNGYAKDRPQFYAELKDITIGEGKPEWGAVPGEKYFCLHLGKIIERGE